MLRSLILIFLWWQLAPSVARAYCTVANSGIAFGGYSMMTPTPRDSSGSVTVTCTVLVGLLVTIYTELGTGVSGSYFPRQMANGANRLNYNLYTDASYSTVWGNGAGGTARRTFSALLTIGTTNIPYTFYGRIPAGQGPPAGAYSDNVVVTVIF